MMNKGEIGMGDIIILDEGQVNSLIIIIEKGEKK